MDNHWNYRKNESVRKRGGHSDSKTRGGGEKRKKSLSEALLGIGRKMIGKKVLIEILEEAKPERVGVSIHKGEAKTNLKEDRGYNIWRGGPSSVICA